MTSSRLPGKVLYPLAGKPALQQMVERVQEARYIDEIVVATTTNTADEPIVQLCDKLRVGCFRGSEDDVLARVLGAAESADADLICELTGDCPLIDPLIIDEVILAHLSGSHDYTSNFFNQRTYPDGLDVQVFPTEILRRVDKLTDDPIDRVHVSCFIYHNPRLFQLNGLCARPEQFGPDIRITLDTEEDYRLIEAIFDAMATEGRFFHASEILGFLKRHPDLLQINQHVVAKTLEEG
jgi:spore coat polysaccharide biosynthesis protein SpsF